MVDVLRYSAFPDLDDPDGRTCGGNPAGVVLDAAGLTDEQQQQIAAEVGYAETAFLVPTGPDRADVRYFAPQQEIAFCGHATVASAVAWAERGSGSTLLVDTPAGPVSVDVDTAPQPPVATLTSPPASSTPLAGSTRDDLLVTLRLAGDDLDPAWPPAVGHAGNNHPIVVLTSRSGLAGLDEDREALRNLMLRHEWTTIALLWPQPEIREIWARNLFPVGGLREDPATGSASAAVGAYLRDQHRAVPGEVWVIRQGHDMGRPSRIDVEIGESTMRVAGAAVPIREA